MQQLSSKHLPPEIQSLTGNYNLIIQPRSEPDFYGASSNIASKLGKKRPPFSYSTWSHGCQSGITLGKEQINWMGTWNLNRLVRNDDVKKFMKQHGFKNVHAVGMPINYTESLVKQRLQKSIVFMPAHSLSYVTMKQNISAMTELALKFKNQGYYVCFCVHRDCVSNGDIVSSLNELKLDWFAGSHASDAYSLQRMRNIFEYFETVLSNTMGSHFFYSQLFGAKFSFIEPYFEYNPEMFINDPFWIKHPDLCRSVIQSMSRLEIYKKFPEYFDIENPKLDQEHANHVCGSDYVREYGDIADLLGWTIKTKILCPLPYFGSKLFYKLKQN